MRSSNIIEDLLRQNIAAYDKFAKDQAEIDRLKREIAAIEILLQKKEAKERRREQAYGKRQSLFSVTVRKMDASVKPLAYARGSEVSHLSRDIILRSRDRQGAVEFNISEPMKWTHPTL